MHCFQEVRGSYRLQSRRNIGRFVRERHSEMHRDYIAVSYALNNDIQEMQINIHITFG